MTGTAAIDVELPGMPPYQRLLRHGILRHFDVGSILSPGTNKSLSLVVHGLMKLFLLWPDGSERIVDILSDGDVFGETSFRGRRYCYEAAVLVPSDILVLEADGLRALILEEPEFLGYLIGSFSRRIRLLVEQVDGLAHHNPVQMICCILYHYNKLAARSVGAGQEVRIQLTHEDLARIAGISRVPVSNAVARLRREGVVRTRYKSLTVVDDKKLKAQALSHNRRG